MQKLAAPAKPVKGDRVSNGSCAGTTRGGHPCKSKALPDVGDGSRCRHHQASHAAGEVDRREVSARVRFEVLKRDKFACQYCGAKAPEVLLEVDHVVPVAGGGTNDIANLLSSCKPCNGGKGARLLSDDTAITKQRAQMEELAARREQLELMMQWQTSLLGIEEDEAKHVADYWTRTTSGWSLSAVGVATIRKLLRKYPSIDIMRAMRASVDQYGKFVDGKLTHETVVLAFNYVPRILGMAKADEENPNLKDYFYIRAIIRNNFKYCDQPTALAMIKEAHEAGVDIEDLKALAKRSTCWMNWSRDMRAWTTEARV